MKAVIYLKMLLLTFSIDEKVVCGQIYTKKFKTAPPLD